MSGQPLRIDRHDSGVVVLTLDQPQVRNAMTPELTAAWAAAVRELKGDPGLRCLVVTGAGTAFCAGGDLGWLRDAPGLPVPVLRDRMLAFYRDWLSVRELQVPTIAAVNGPAVGAGLCLALACDLRYAGATAQFAAPFVRLGLHPGMGATWLLPEAVGVPRARELLLTGRSVGAAEAVGIGLASSAFPDERLLPEVLALAGRIAAAAPVALRLTKAALQQGGPASLAEALDREGLAQPVTMATADVQEGLAAAADRRAPTFGGA